MPRKKDPVDEDPRPMFLRGGLKSVEEIKQRAEWGLVRYYEDVRGRVKTEDYRGPHPEEYLPFIKWRGEERLREGRVPNHFEHFLLWQDLGRPLCDEETRSRMVKIYEENGFLSGRKYLNPKHKARDPRKQPSPSPPRGGQREKDSSPEAPVVPEKEAKQHRGRRKRQKTPSPEPPASPEASPEPPASPEASPEPPASPQKQASPSPEPPASPEKQASPPPKKRRGRKRKTKTPSPEASPSPPASPEASPSPPPAPKRGRGRPPKAQQKKPPAILGGPRRAKAQEGVKLASVQVPEDLAPVPFRVDASPVHDELPTFLKEVIDSGSVAMDGGSVMDMELIVRNEMISLFDGDCLEKATMKILAEKAWINHAYVGTLFHRAVCYFFKIYTDPEANKDTHAKEKLSKVVKWCMLTYERSCDGAVVPIEMAYAGLVRMCKRFDCKFTDVSSQLKGMFEILSEHEKSDDVVLAKVLVFRMWQRLMSVLRGPQFWNLYYDDICVPLLGEECKNDPRECVEGLKELAGKCTNDIDRYMLDHCVFVTSMWSDIYDMEKEEVPKLAEWFDDIGEYHLKFLLDVDAKYAVKQPSKVSKQKCEIYAKAFLERISPLFGKARGFSKYAEPRVARVDYEIACIHAKSITEMRGPPEL